jgi:photosystem II stability/assembly factor-like uncharacterized protein
MAVGIHPVPQLELSSRTTDGGATWTTSYGGGHWGFLENVVFANSNTVVTWGGIAIFPWFISYSIDGGRTFAAASIPDGPIRYLTGLSFGDPNTGTAVAYGYPMEPGGFFLRTTDGGASWRRQPSPLASYVRATSFVDANTGTGVGLRGVIARTETGGD